MRRAEIAAAIAINERFAAWFLASLDGAVDPPFRLVSIRVDSRNSRAILLFSTGQMAGYVFIFGRFVWVA